jgi:hypothetical protein
MYRRRCDERVSCTTYEYVRPSRNRAAYLFDNEFGLVGLRGEHVVRAEHAAVGERDGYDRRQHFRAVVERVRLRLVGGKHAAQLETPTVAHQTALVGVRDRVGLERRRFQHGADAFDEEARVVHELAARALEGERLRVADAQVGAVAVEEVARRVAAQVHAHAARRLHHVVVVDGFVRVREGLERGDDARLLHGRESAVAVNGRPVGGVPSDGAAQRLDSDAAARRRGANHGSGRSRTVRHGGHGAVRSLHTHVQLGMRRSAHDAGRVVALRGHERRRRR